MPSCTFAYGRVLWGASRWTRHPELEGSYQARPSMSGGGASRIRQYHPIASVTGGKREHQLLALVGEKLLKTRGVCFEEGSAYSE